MTVIIILILLGIFLLGVELFLLPGISVAGIGALGACGFAVYKAFADYGNTGGLLALAAVIVLSVILVIVGMRAKTWNRLSLKNKIDSSSQPNPENENIKPGDRGTTITRLAPVGKVQIGDRTFEAKSIDVYIDPRKTVEVTGFDNFSILVREAEDTTHNA